MPVLQGLCPRGLPADAAEEFAGVAHRLLPLAFTSPAGAPRFTLIASTGPRRRRVSDHPSVLSQAPQWARGTAGHPCHPVASPRHGCSLGAGRGDSRSLPLTVPSGQVVRQGGRAPSGQTRCVCTRQMLPQPSPASWRLTAASRVPCRGLRLTLQSVLHGVTPTAHPPPDKADGDFLPGHPCAAWRTCDPA